MPAAAADLRPDQALEQLKGDDLVAFADRLFDEERFGELHHLADALIRERDVTASTIRSTIATLQELASPKVGD